MKGKNPDRIREMFDKISPKYVLINKLMTFGQDRYWRNELIRLSGLKDGDNFLDVATGTGDVILEIFKRGFSLNRIAGLDFSTGMLEVARKRIRESYKVEWIEGVDTFILRDDVYLITGEADGIRANGYTWEREIINPLRKEIGCKHFVSGTVEMRPEGLSIRLLDYGNGECDNIATVIIDGVVYTIMLP
ncbi:MAG: class I SAM-dependent methyltransferase [Spirochaetales bacterium]|nr:class I SAM-dependent methyltransferase [Spirochaetales bacterium]